MIYHDFSCRECLLNSDNLNGGMSGLTEQKIQAIYCQHVAGEGGVPWAAVVSLLIAKRSI